MALVASQIRYRGLSHRLGKQAAARHDGADGERAAQPALQKQGCTSLVNRRHGKR
jgi:hypothetical protein